MGQLTARDYKKPSGGSLEPRRFREFGAGLLVGVVATALLFGIARRHQHAQARQHASMGSAHVARPHAAPGSAGSAAAQAGDPASTASGANDASSASGAGSGAVDPARHYDFYQMLPHFEVIVPQKEHPVAPAFPTAPIQHAGVYVLQAGSYRREPEADRVAQQLAAKGIPAKVERVAIDADVWYRVRVGPISKLSRLNRLRAKLHAANVDSLAIRVGD